MYGQYAGRVKRVGLSIRRATMSKNYVSMKVFYTKVTPHDKEGLIEVENLGWPEKCFCSNAGDVFRVTTENHGKTTRMMGFVAELNELIKKYFDDVPPATEG